MKIKIFLKGISIFILLMIGSFALLYLIIEPMVQSAYKKGYEQGNIDCEEYEQPVMNPFGEFEITINYTPHNDTELPRWDLSECCYPTECPESVNNPEHCTCTYPIYCNFYYNLS